MAPKIGCKASRWNSEEMTVLIDLWKEATVDIVEGRSAQLAVTEIHQKFSFYFSNKGTCKRNVKQVAVKISNMKRKLRGENDKVKLNGESTWPFYESITEIYNIYPNYFQYKGFNMDFPASDSDASIENETYHSRLKRKSVPAIHEKPVESAAKKRKSNENIPFPSDDTLPKEETISKTPSQHEEKDELDFFGIYVASTLRDMPAESALSLKNKINLLFFHENLNVSHESQKMPRSLQDNSSNKNGEPFASGVLHESWIIPSGSKPCVQGSDYTVMNGTVKTTKEIPVSTKEEDECDTFCKCISTQMKTLPLKNRVQLYADIQNVVVKNRVQSLTESDPQ